MKKLYVFFWFFIISISSGIAQIEDPKIEKHDEGLRSMITVYLKTGEVYKGYFISQNKDFLEIESISLGKITIHVTRIKKIEPADNDAKAVILDIEETEVDDLNSMRYFFGTSGFNLERGKSYVRNNPMTFHRGITDNFSIGVGTSFFFGLLGVPILFVNPHYTKSISKNLHFKAGMGAAIGVSRDEGSGAGALLNTGLTLGDRDLNVTGTFYFGAITEGGNFNFASLAGKARVSRRLAIVSENMFFYGNEFEENAILIYGIRYITSSGSFDLGFINSRDFREFFYIGIPFISLTLKL